jgi:polyhydroxybutyrate depolymerase
MMKCVTAMVWMWMWNFGSAFALAQAPLQYQEWMVDGVKREALLHVPAQVAENGMPVVFAFHGHGGSMRNSARAFPIPALWPEALVVYMQGLPTPGQLTDPEGKKAGWQHGAEDQGGRDLKFFDAVFSSLKAKHRIDESRVYSMGHSNGGGFTYLLWAERGELFAAMAPSGSAGRQYVASLKPKPVLHVAGERDPLVKYAWQERMMEALRELNQCGEGVAWNQDETCTYYASRIGSPVVTAIHPGGHEYPKAAPGVIVKFFKQHRKAGVKPQS